ncbi:MAG: hypothetical protein HYZ00_01145, partial [Candidatus Hydrogenedentes bacterium]|nr:hypothetical protein [Candidatus Hydrogenedentota bacterium]
LALEISQTTALACLRVIRTRIELTQTLRRPHPVATVRAIVMEILEDVPETAFLFSRAVTLPREWRRPAAAVQRARRSDAPKPWGPATERRVTQPLSFRHFRNFEPGEGHRSVDAYRRLDRETFRRHLKQVRRRPEPPTPDLWGANHV